MSISVIISIQDLRPAEIWSRLPDEEAGEIPAACVVLSKGAKETEDDIMKFVASNIATYKKVRVVQFVESIPKSPSGKILRRLLRDRLLEKIEKP